MERLPLTPWIKASASANNGNCVELARLTDGNVAIRDSKDPDGGWVSCTPGQWTSFLASVKAGLYDECL